MQFNILGPLEVVAQDRVVPLGGIKQRAMLGMLLLKANRIVPSSKLLDSLWADGVPPTARKMLQNAASALRGMLACDGGSADPPVLLTHTPGYLLHVEPSTIDLNLFTLHTERGRSYAAQADWESARRALRDALDVWRGPVLSDLTETCGTWPEAAAVQNTHLVAVEELFDAELACGRHREVVAELELVAGRELSHERLVAQLMLAMYRCGRQLDALDIYRRARVSLIETHGLEPSRELQELEHLILNQDVRLDWHGGAMPALGDSGIAGVPWPTATLADKAVQAAALSEDVTAGPRRPEPAPKDDNVVPLAQGQLATLMAVVGEVERRPGADLAETANALGMVAATVDREVSRYGGVVISRVASVSWIVFDDADHAPDRAVDAGLAIRDALEQARSVHDAADSGAPQVVVKVAVVSTDAILSYHPGDGTLRGLDSAVVGRCLQLASAAPAGRVWVGEETKRATECCVRYERVGDGAWDAVELLPEPHRPDRVKMVIGGPGKIQKLRGLLAGMGGQHTSPLIERISRRGGGIPENAVVEVTVSVLLPADDVHGWAALPEGT
ncbi:AfsR/SARP family transcriptional regulator [Streptomyces sp. FXJ1.172]|uniref:AfsR/SARP family transcriptional regulator n=1 Tax=Streptomyces sp. FXJ1.172 TaxID=710705 RepID=UPI0007CFE180|nr:AfsR/SARP family transcriptional regulator [Streptomyces sp. FXJ1.172]WEO93652.1 AfsR/SARP family transcriptional regulator [Streptomyces sp. FXJ1.172]